MTSSGRSLPLFAGLCTWSYPPEKSGLSRAAREIAESLVSAGHAVRVFTMDRSGREVVNGVDIIGCQPGRKTPAAWLRRRAVIGHLVAPWHLASAVRAEHERQPFDIMEATNWYAPGLFVARRTGLPLVTRHSTPAATSIEQPQTRRNRLDAAAVRSLERWSARGSAGHISNMPLHAAKIAALYDIPPAGPRHAVIGLSLPPDFKNMAAEASYPASDGVIQLLFVGRNEARKGADLLLAAGALLADEGARGEIPDFHICAIGLEEQDLRDIRPSLRRRITCHHRLEDADLRQAYVDAHIVAAPSRYESFGLVYQEALAFGRPVAALATDPSACEVIGKSAAGLLANSATGAAYAAALRKLICSPALRQRCRLAALRAAGRFTRQTLAAETVAVYHAALSVDRTGEAAPVRRRAGPRQVPSLHIPGSATLRARVADSDQSRRTEPKSMPATDAPVAHAPFPHSEHVSGLAGTAHPASDR